VALNGNIDLINRYDWKEYKGDLKNLLAHGKGNKIKID